MDGNDNSRQPGDYQAGGGRQHAKTLVIDGKTENPVVLTGSFNWSSSATVANDEVLLVLTGDYTGHQYSDYFDYLWEMAKRIGNRYLGDRPGQPTGLQPGDVVFNEIQWDGYNGLVDPAETQNEATMRADHFVYNDEFIELFNTTPYPIDMSMWTIATDDDFAVGLYPGTVIGPYEHFLIVDHNTEAYDDLRPQMMGGAYLGADFVMNTANDGRFRPQSTQCTFAFAYSTLEDALWTPQEMAQPLSLAADASLDRATILGTRSFIQWSEFTFPVLMMTPVRKSEMGPIQHPGRVVI